jgi:serine/threonine-protein kinase
VGGYHPHVVGSRDNDEPATEVRTPFVRPQDAPAAPVRPPTGPPARPALPSAVNAPPRLSVPLPGPEAEPRTVKMAPFARPPPAVPKTAEAPLPPPKLASKEDSAARAQPHEDDDVASDDDATQARARDSLRARTAATDLGLRKAKKAHEDEDEAGKEREPPASMPHVGALIGKYVVDRVIGAGGMGLVLAARNQALNELVAIKLLRPKAAGDKVHAERFAREARAIIKIKSEHVVRVLDAGTLESGAPYIVMEYLVGRDLSQRLRAEGRMPTSEAADLMLQVCEAVASAHAVGVVHRDLKPSNFFLTQRPDGTTLLKVLDFGIAKAIGQEGVVDPNLTETQAVFGSPTYMSPEQIRSAKHVDHRSDVWSLGVALYELMTGKLPFAADNVAGLLASIIADPPFLPRAFAPDLPPALEELVLQCLHKDVRGRVQSVADLAFRLAPFAIPSGETQSLVERIDRLSRGTGSGTITGPKLPTVLPSGSVGAIAKTIGPSSSRFPVASPGTPSTTPSGANDAGPVAFGRTGMDLSAEARRSGTWPAIAVGVGAAAIILAGVGAYRLGMRDGRSPPAAVPPGSIPSASLLVPSPSSLSPPTPPETASAPAPSSANVTSDSADSAGSPSPRPSSQPGFRRNPKHPGRPPPPKPVDPIGDRF